MPIVSTGLKGGQTFVFAVRVQDAKKKRLSDFSDRRGRQAAALPLPAGRTSGPTVFADRIEVRWDAPGANFDGSAPALIKGYNIYRQSIEERQTARCALNAALVAEPSFADKDFVFEPGLPLFRPGRGLGGRAVPRERRFGGRRSPAQGHLSSRRARRIERR